MSINRSLVVLQALRDALSAKSLDLYSLVVFQTTEEKVLSYGFWWIGLVPQIVVQVIYKSKMTTDQKSLAKQAIEECLLDCLSGPDLYGFRVYLEYISE